MKNPMIILVADIISFNRYVFLYNTRLPVTRWARLSLNFELLEEDFLFYIYIYIYIVKELINT